LPEESRSIRRWARQSASGRINLRLSLFEERTANEWACIFAQRRSPKIRLCCGKEAIFCTAAGLWHFRTRRTFLTIRSPLSSWKLLLATGIFTRPKYRAIWHALLRPFIHNGEISVRYRCSERYVTMFIRVSELSSDLQCALELAVRDEYHLDQDFQPDLVIDGGGNIGLFTLVPPLRRPATLRRSSLSASLWPTISKESRDISISTI
jgi:hypothetical protein